LKKAISLRNKHENSGLKKAVRIKERLFLLQKYLKKLDFAAIS